jgi:hypothetical protein
LTFGQSWLELLLNHWAKSKLLCDASGGGEELRYINFFWGGGDFVKDAYVSREKEYL